MTKTRLVTAAILALALLALPSAALAKDSDHDGMPNGWERAHGLNPNKANARKDPDHDGLRNLGEFRHRTDPRRADSDGDSLRDGREVELGDNPNNRDTDDDGIEDGDELAGTVQSFDSGTGLLTILLADGTTTRSGTVDATTRIKCEDHSHAVHAASHGADDGPNHDVGDDHGGQTPSASSSGSDDGTGGHGRRGHGGRSNCTTAELVAGRVVHEAKLVKSGSGGFVFRKVELDG